MSFKYEVHGSGDPVGHFVANGLRFATADEAEQYGHDLGMRWFGFDEGRVAESTDPVTHQIVDNVMSSVEETDEQHVSED